MCILGGVIDVYNDGGFYQFGIFVASPSGRTYLMYECHGTAPTACTVLWMVSPLRGDFWFKRGLKVIIV